MGKTRGKYSKIRKVQIKKILVDTCLQDPETVQFVGENQVRISRGYKYQGFTRDQDNRYPIIWYTIKHNRMVLWRFLSDHHDFIITPENRKLQFSFISKGK